MHDRWPRLLVVDYYLLNETLSEQELAIRDHRTRARIRLGVVGMTARRDGSEYVLNGAKRGSATRRSPT